MSRFVSFRHGRTADAPFQAPVRAGRRGVLCPPSRRQLEKGVMEHETQQETVRHSAAVGCRAKARPSRCGGGCGAAGAAQRRFGSFAHLVFQGLRLQNPDLLTKLKQPA